MGTNRTAILIVGGDPPASAALAREAAARGYAVRTAASVDEAFELTASTPADVILVALAPGVEHAVDLLPDLARLARDADVLVMSGDRSMAATLPCFDTDAVAFVPRGDAVQVFGALDRAVERRRITRQNRRLMWELQTLTEIARGIPRSVDLGTMLNGALQGLVRAMAVEAGSIRLRDDDTGTFVNAVALGTPAIDRFLAALRGTTASDLVMARRAAVTISDLAELSVAARVPPPLPLRSAIGVPMFAGAELVGTLSLGAARPGRFDAADEHLLSSVACQLVVAIQNVRLHQTLSRGKAEWEATFDAISDPIAVFNDKGELLRGNLALAEYLSMPITALRYLTCAQTDFCVADRVTGACGCRATDGVPARTCREVTLADGRIFSVTAFPVGQAGQGASVVQVAKNVTEEIHSARRLQQMSRELAAMNDRLVAALTQLKTMQAQLVQAEKLSAMGHLVAGVAHELNNPLTSVIGYAQLVEEALSGDAATRLPSEVGRDIRRIVEESNRAARIVRNLLAFARQQSTARAPHDLVEICSQTLALRTYELALQQIVLETDLPEALPPVLTDAGQLQQVLLNLLLNAEHAMRGAEVRRLRIAARHDEVCGAVELSIADTGHGIDPANVSRVFDPFFTTRAVGEGTGLGLSICYGIVRDHGGTIAVDSTPGVGTTFRLLLPARLPPDRAGGRVVVAHADEGERDYVAAACSAWGYQPVPVTSLHEALVEARTARLVIVDRSLQATEPDFRARLCQAGMPPALVLAPDDLHGDWTGAQSRVQVLVPPIDLRSLAERIHACAKECV